MREESAAQAKISFAVRDTGIGIPADAQDRIFRSFSQVDGSITRKYGGTGLGLAICKQLVGMMGGDIGMQSMVGAGSTFDFTVSLKTQPAAGDCRPEPDQVDIRGKRILAVDDNKSNRNLLQAYLQAWQCNVTVAGDAKEALGILSRAAETSAPFDMVIIDFMMPEMDGKALGQTIKGHSKLQDIPMVLLTSQAMRGDAAQAKETGFDAYLTKPIKQSLLKRTLLAVLGKQGKHFPEIEAKALVTRHSIAESSKKEIHILVAEDNEINQKVALHILDKLGFQAKAVNNGRQAIEALDRDIYHMVLMDIQMPEMDGFETTRQIRRSQNRYRTIPIVAMTAHAMQGDQERCIEAGMNDYIAKPVNPNELHEKVEEWISYGNEDAHL